MQPHSSGRCDQTEQPGKRDDRSYGTPDVTAGVGLRASPLERACIGKCGGAGDRHPPSGADQLHTLLHAQATRPDQVGPRSVGPCAVAEIAAVGVTADDDRRRSCRPGHGRQTGPAVGTNWRGGARHTGGRPGGGFARRRRNPAWRKLDRRLRKTRLQRCCQGGVGAVTQADAGGHATCFDQRSGGKRPHAGLGPSFGSRVDEASGQHLVLLQLHGGHRLATGGRAQGVVGLGPHRSGKGERTGCQGSVGQAWWRHGQLLGVGGTVLAGRAAERPTEGLSDGSTQPAADSPLDVPSISRFTGCAFAAPQRCHFPTGQPGMPARRCNGSRKPFRAQGLERRTAAPALSTPT